LQKGVHLNAALARIPKGKEPTQMKTRSLVCAVTLSLVAIVNTLTTHAQPVIQNVRKTNSTQLHFDIQGGTGPFLIQRGSIADDPFCSFALVSQGNNVGVSADGPQAFLGVRDLSTAHPTRLTAWLTGAGERPTTNASTAVGFGTFELNGDSLTFDIAYSGLGSAFQDAHIHLSADSQGTAGPAISLPAFAVGSLGTTGRFAGVVTLTLAQRVAVLDGKAYVNVHSATFGGGEIRGQITPTTFKVVMRGIAERPTFNNSPAIGIGVLTLIGRELSYHISFQGLVANASASHIHGAADTAGAASVMYDLIRPTTTSRAGTLVGRTNLTAAQIGAIVDRKAYANLHSVTFGGGEVRGQVSPFIGELPFTAELTGAAERPTPVVTSASGFAVVHLLSNTLAFAVTYRNLSSTANAAHIHGAATTAGTAGPIIDLQPYHRGTFSTQGLFVGSVTLSPQNVSNLLNGDLYVNVHSISNGGGEIRGQLCPTIMPVTLNGANERPNPVATVATGFGFAGMVGKQFSLGVHYRDLQGDGSDAHIHGPGGTNDAVGVLFGVFPGYVVGGVLNRTGFMMGSQALTDGQAANIADYLTYLNIHSGFAGGGEIRGQVQP
jgi:hypothetical protein